MRTITGRLFSILLALMIALSMLIPMVGVGTLDSVNYVLPPGDFKLYQDNYGGNQTGFDIYYDPSRIVDVGDVVLPAHEAYDNVSNFFGPFSHRTRVIIAANHLQYIIILNANTLPDSDVASNYNDGVLSTIVIEEPDLVPNFETLLANELTHVELRNQLTDHKYSLPYWFSEGLARYVSGGFSDADKSTVEQLSRENKIMTVAQMESIEEHSGNASLNISEDDVNTAYAQSSMLINYVISKYGNDTIKQIIANFGSSGNLDDAFMSIVGYSPEDINADMIQTIKQDLAARDGRASAQLLSGYLKGPDGSPVANETVMLTNMNNSSIFYVAKTNESGFYRLNLLDGNYTIEADMSGYSPVSNNSIIPRGTAVTVNLTFSDPLPAAGMPSTTSGSQDTDYNAYTMLFGVNAAAILLIGFVFLRTRK